MNRIKVVQILAVFPSDMHTSVGEKLLELFNRNPESFLYPVIDACTDLDMKNITRHNINKRILSILYPYLDVSF